MVFQPALIDFQVSSAFPQSEIPEGQSMDLVMADIRRVADGLDVLTATGATEDDLAAFRIPALILSGGEPLSRPDTLNLAQRAKSHGLYIFRR